MDVHAPIINSVRAQWTNCFATTMLPKFEPETSIETNIVVAGRTPLMSGYGESLPSWRSGGCVRLQPQTGRRGRHVRFSLVEWPLLGKAAVPYGPAGKARFDPLRTFACT